MSSNLPYLSITFASELECRAESICYIYYLSFLTYVISLLSLVGIDLLSID